MEEARNIKTYQDWGFKFDFWILSLAANHICDITCLAANHMPSVV